MKKYTSQKKSKRNEYVDTPNTLGSDTRRRG